MIYIEVTSKYYTILYCNFIYRYNEYKSSPKIIKTKDYLLNYLYVKNLKKFFKNSQDNH